jgi:hypothetical protein
MKRAITIFKIWSVIYWGIYSITAFYKWELYNPFWWILEMPKNQDLRYKLLIAFPTVIILMLAFYFVFLNKKGQLITPANEHLEK